MKKTIKRLWIKALRSGKYQQAKYYLHPAEDQFCCLGVLCDLHRKANRKGPSAWEDKLDVFWYQGQAKHLPDSVIKWAGLETNMKDMVTANVPIPGTFTSLSSINDKGTSFEEIATLIDEKL